MKDLKPRLNVDRGRLVMAIAALLRSAGDDLTMRAMKLFENLTDDEIERFGNISEFRDAENQSVLTQVQYYRLGRLLILGSMQAVPEKGELWYLVGAEAIKADTKAIGKIAKNRP